MDNSTEERLQNLEKQVAELKEFILNLSSQKTKQDPPKEKKETPFISQDKSRTAKILLKPDTDKNQQSAKNSEKWLGRLGIGLLLFGAIFLFKYSIDQGWITPLIRVLFGLGLGIILLVFGLRLYEKNKMISRLLIGGGIATYYISIFASFQLYGLVSHGLAFTFMSLVTILAYLLALRQNEHILSLIGALGGFLTPFLLYTGQSNIAGLVSYTSLLIVGSVLTYLMRGWRLLLWFSSVCAWIIWGIALDTINSSPYSVASEQWSLQIGIIISWLVFAAFPLIREHLEIKNPQKWAPPDFITLQQRISIQAVNLVKRQIHLLSLTTPIVALLFTRYIWDLTHINAGWINLIVGILYLAFFLVNHKNSTLKSLILTQAITSIVIITWAILLLLEGDTQFFVLALEAWVLFIIAQKSANSRMETLARIFLFIMGISLLLRVFSGMAHEPFLFNTSALVDLLFIIILGYVSVKLKKDEQSIIYFSLAHIALMGWLLRELHGFNNGLGLVTVFWGILALVIFILGFRLKKTQWRYLGSFTIIVVVGKLFLVDLVELETIWRILLFIGFGGLLIIVSYYLRKFIGNSTHVNKTNFKAE